jgi:hypothetical protein
MLIDVSRKPVRLISEECSPFIVIRTMAMNEIINGLLYWGTEVQTTKANNHVNPKMILKNGGIKHIETVLWFPGYVLGRSDGVDARFHTVSRFQDQITKELGTWHIDFIVDTDPTKDNFLLTLFDEEQKIMLFTVRVNKKAFATRKEALRIITPLERHAAMDQRKQKFGNATGLWGAILEDDFDDFEVF